MPPLDGVHRFQKGEGFVDRSFEGGKKETRKNTNLKRERGGLMKLAGWLDLLLEESQARMHQMCRPWMAYIDFRREKDSLIDHSREERNE